MKRNIRVAVFVSGMLVSQIGVAGSLEDLSASKIQKKYRAYRATLYERAFLKTFSCQKDLEKDNDPISRVEQRLVEIAAEDPTQLQRNEADLEAGEKFSGDITDEFLQQLDQVKKINTRASKESRDYGNLAEYAYWTKRYDLSAKIRVKQYSQFARISYKGFQYRDSTVDLFVVDVERSFDGYSFKDKSSLQAAKDLGLKVISDEYLDLTWLKHGISDLEVDGEGFAYFYKAIAKNQLCKIRNGGLDSKFGGRNGATKLAGLGGGAFEANDCGKQFMCDKYATTSRDDGGYDKILKKSGDTAVLLLRIPASQSHLFNFSHSNGSWIIAGTTIPPEYIYVETENHQFENQPYALSKEVEVTRKIKRDPPIMVCEKKEDGSWGEYPQPWEIKLVKEKKTFVPITTATICKNNDNETIDTIISPKL